MNEELNTTFQLCQYDLSMTRNSFVDEKAMSSFVRKCISAVRQSPEYREWVAYVKDVLGFKTCVFTEETSDELTIEIHHHPLTLYEIVELEIVRHINNNYEFCSMDIVKRVMELHYSNNVGYLPIVSSLHEKYHNGFLIIPPKFVNGIWNYVLTHDEYNPGDDVLLKVGEVMKEDNNQYDTYAWKRPVGVVNG